MFQSFPLGDRSSVNLRGEYHVENITVYEDVESKLEARFEDGMDVDRAEVYDGRDAEAMKEDPPVTEPMSQDDATRAMSTTKDTKMDIEDGKESKEHAHDMDTLYPIFWSLQESFSTPTRLFDDANLSSFQAGLEATMHKFKKCPLGVLPRSLMRASVASNEKVLMITSTMEKSFPPASIQNTSPVETSSISKSVIWRFGVIS